MGLDSFFELTMRGAGLEPVTAVIIGPPGVCREFLMIYRKFPGHARILIAGPHTGGRQPAHRRTLLTLHSGTAV